MRNRGTRLRVFAVFFYFRKKARFACSPPVVDWVPNKIENSMKCDHVRMLEMLRRELKKTFEVTIMSLVSDT